MCMEVSFFPFLSLSLLSLSFFGFILSIYFKLTLNTSIEPEKPDESMITSGTDICSSPIEYFGSYVTYWRRRTSDALKNSSVFNINLRSMHHQVLLHDNSTQRFLLSTATNIIVISLMGMR
ncbi:hypothetical protein IW262DRAFT_1369059 [Armillaria fumosa]|nr:hypothetical protein IW262DRAFT_1369059 [Armillaria fumosa]